MILENEPSAASSSSSRAAAESRPEPESLEQQVEVYLANIVGKTRNLAGMELADRWPELADREEEILGRAGLDTDIEQRMLPNIKKRLLAALGRG